MQIYTYILIMRGLSATRWDSKRPLSVLQIERDKEWRAACSSCVRKEKILIECGEQPAPLVLGRKRY